MGRKKMNTKASESKQRIRSIALDLIKEKGYDSVTINNICTAAKISKNTFYYYFKSKEDLLVQFDDISPMTAGNLASVIMEETSVEQYWKLMEPVLDSIVDQGPEVTKHMLYAFTKQKIQTFSTSEFFQNINAVVATIIERAQASGEIRNTSEPTLLLATTGTQFLGVVSAWGTMDGNFDLKDAFRLTMEVSFDLKPELRRAPSDVLSGMHLGI